MKFEHKKSLGQNFLSNKNLLAALADDANVANENVLEIGPGLGALTTELGLRANKVLAIETDTRLQIPLEEKFEGTNVEFLFDDFMKVGFDQIEKVLGKSYVVAANLPYYITTPILFRFFEEKNGAKRISVMVQKEVALRMCAKPGTKDYGILSVACQHMGKTKILRNVSRQNFNPVPNVDSAFVGIELENKDNQKPFFNFLRACFQMRRKTLQNNLKGVCDIAKVCEWLDSQGKPQDVRAEALFPQEIFDLFEFVSKNAKK